MREELAERRGAQAPRTQARPGCRRGRQPSQKRRDGALRGERAAQSARPRLARRGRIERLLALHPPHFRRGETADASGAPDLGYTRDRQLLVAQVGQGATCARRENAAGCLKGSGSKMKSVRPNYALTPASAGAARAIAPDARAPSPR